MKIWLQVGWFANMQIYMQIKIIKVKLSKLKLQDKKFS